MPKYGPWLDVEDSFSLINMFSNILAKSLFANLGEIKISENFVAVANYGNWTVYDEYQERCYLKNVEISAWEEHIDKFNIDSVEIFVVSDERNVPKVDGYLYFDKGSFDEPCVVTIVCQSNKEEIIGSDELQVAVKSVIAHELYHALCRVHDNIGVPGHLIELDEHARNPEETGARVIEAMVALGRERCFNKAKFKETLTDMLRDYLLRNNIVEGSSKYDDLLDDMLTSHMIEYYWITDNFGD